MYSITLVHPVIRNLLGFQRFRSLSSISKLKYVYKENNENNEAKKKMNVILKINLKIVFLKCIV